jgi:hypothetical protein
LGVLGAKNLLDFVITTAVVVAFLAMAMDFSEYLYNEASKSNNTKAIGIHIYPR